MSDLTEFLLARAAEDEAVARAALDDPKRPDDSSEPTGRLFYDGGWGSDREVLAPPRFVLAECEAKRRIIDLAGEATGLDIDVDGEMRGLGSGVRDEQAEPYIGDLILRALAAPYAEHPDYRPEWRSQ